MKLPSFIAFLAFATSSAAAEMQHEYLGYNVTSPADGDLALCGNKVWGCVSTPENAYGCRAYAKLGSLEDVGSDSQRFIYHDGLLKTKIQNSNSWWSDREVCLGPRSYQLTSDRSYKLKLQACPLETDDARHMRFIISEGQVQSLAPVSSTGDDESTEPFCMAIDGDVVMKSAGSDIVLRPCDPEGSSLQQDIQAFGTIEPFVSSLQHRWGMDDVVELAFTVGMELEESPVTVDVSKVSTYSDEEDAVVLSLEADTSAGVLSFNVSSLGDDAPVGEYVAKFEMNNVEYSTSFFVEEEPHIMVCGTYRSAMSSSGGALGIVLTGAAVGLLLVWCFLSYFVCRKSAETRMDSVEEETVAEEDDEEGFVKASLQKDDTDTSSQTTSSDHEDLSLASDQA